MLNVINLKARDLPDAWFQCLYSLVENGRQETVDHGSYEGQTRLEFDYVTCHITHPGIKPLIPEIPPALGIPNPTDMEYVECRYLPYLLEDSIQPNETYTYGLYIKPQMNKIIERYKSYKVTTGGYRSNQEHIIVGDYRDHLQMTDPPCLRGIDTRIQDNKLHFYVYFRSWDLWAGFPSNLAAIQIMKQHMSEEIGVEDGEMIVASKGMHVYGYAFELVKMRTYQQLQDKKVTGWK